MDISLEATTEKQEFVVRLSEAEIVAVINRLIPEGTWAKKQSDRVVSLTFTDPEEAQRVADTVTRDLIHAFDRNLS